MLATVNKTDCQFGHKIVTLHAMHLCHHAEGLRRSIVALHTGITVSFENHNGWIRWCDECQRALEWIPEV